MTSSSASQSGDPVLVNSSRLYSSASFETIQDSSEFEDTPPSANLISLDAFALVEHELHASFEQSSFGLHAPPLMSLRSRDWQVLSDLFNIDGIDEIEMDILCNLNQVVTTPCWEEDLTPGRNLQDLL